MNVTLRLARLCLAFGAAASLAAQEKTPDDPILNQFAAVNTLLRQGQPAEAERMLDQVQLRANRSTFQLGKATLSAYGFSSVLLIQTYVDWNAYSDAERVAQDRVAWAERQYGSSALQVGGILTQLAEIERLQRKYGEAEPLYLRALSIFRSLNLGNCLGAKTVFTGLGETYLGLKRPGAAEELLRPAINECRDKFGEKGIGRYDLLNVYAVALAADQRPEEATAAASEADRIGTPDPRFQQEDRDLLRGRLLAAQGQVEEGLSYCREWVKVFEVPDGDESDRRLMLPLLECERLLLAAGRKTEAYEFRSRLNETRTKYDVHF